MLSREKCNTDIKILTAPQIIYKHLQKQGVEFIFGYPGSVVLGIYDELCRQNSIKHILVRHEQFAVHAAEGYARSTGKCGVVLVTSGPGVTNTITGILDAYLDGVPLVILSGQVHSELLGRDAFQEADICSMTKSCTKANFQVKSAVELEAVLVKAFQIALSGKKGPVLVDITKDVLDGSARWQNLEPISFVNPPLSGDCTSVLAEITSSSKPVIVSGGGVVQSDAGKELYEFAKLLDIPVVTTMMGLGSFPEDDKNYCGMIGIYGDYSANQILRESDLILSIGARFNDRITCCFDDEPICAKFIQLDINGAEFSRNIKAYKTLLGDAKDFLKLMLKAAKSQKRSDWIAYANVLKSKNSHCHKVSEKLHSFEIMQMLDEFTQGQEVIFTTEVGQHQMFAAQNLTINSSRKFISSCGAGTMGFGLPAAIGAAVANPKIPVICIAGDGSLQMNIQELATCKDYNLPVKIIVINNGYLGMVRQLQETRYCGRYFETEISNPDFVKLAESYGINALRVTKKDEIIPALKFAFNTSGTVLLDFLVEPMEKV